MLHSLSSTSMYTHMRRCFLLEKDDFGSVPSFARHENLYLHRTYHKTTLSSMYFSLSLSRCIVVVLLLLAISILTCSFSYKRERERNAISQRSAWINFFFLMQSIYLSVCVLPVANGLFFFLTYYQFSLLRSVLL